MMRGSKALAVAVRDPKGHIVIHTEPISASLYNGRISRTPFLRGWRCYGIRWTGMRALMYPPTCDGEIGVEFKGPIAWAPPPRLCSSRCSLSCCCRADWRACSSRHSAMGQRLAEGVVRLLLFIGYIWLIARMEDIRRVFAYHGAEHKTINAYEAGSDLTVPRCSARPCCIRVAAPPFC